MLVKVKTTEQLKNEFNISFRNNCGDLVSKFSDLSVINGFSYATSKLVQHLNKSASQIEASLFPDSATGELLDLIANREGIPGRGIGSKSSCVLLLKGAEGTHYAAGQQASSASGIVFEIAEDLILDTSEYGFVIAESTTIGTQANVAPNTITILNGSAPNGHLSVTNLVKAIGGTDSEDDYLFRKRIMGGEFILSRNTQAFYEALIYNIDSNVLRLKTNASGSVNREFTLTLVKNSLADFTNNEITAIRNGIQDNLPLSDRNNLKINIENITWSYIDIYVPIKKIAGYILKDILINMQLACTNYIDLTKWVFGGTVDWEVLYTLCNNVAGVKDIIDVSFTPRSDVLVNENSLPRLRSFSVYDVDNDVTEGEVYTPEFFIHDNKEYAIYSQIIG